MNTEIRRNLEAIFTNLKMGHYTVGCEHCQMEKAYGVREATREVSELVLRSLPVRVPDDVEQRTDYGAALVMDSECNKALTEIIDKWAVKES